MPDILGFVPHAGCLNFVIKYILLIVAKEYFQFIGAVTLAAHKYHFLSNLPFPALAFMLLYCGDIKRK